MRRLITMLIGLLAIAAISASAAARPPGTNGQITFGRFNPGLGDTQVYVSRGTGYWGPPMRLAAPAEITRVTLRTA